MNQYGYIELKKYFIEHGIKHAEVADLLEINPGSFSVKINKKNGADFSLEEARVICSHYKLEMESFFK